MKVYACARAALFAGLVFALQGCLKHQPGPEGLVVVSKPSATPVGAQEYCWQEPRVSYEQNGPGLDAKGEYYHPHYMAVREVKMGRWTPCKR